MQASASQQSLEHLRKRNKVYASFPVLEHQMLMRGLQPTAKSHSIFYGGVYALLYCSACQDSRKPCAQCFMMSLI